MLRCRDRPAIPERRAGDQRERHPLYPQGRQHRDNYSPGYTERQHGAGTAPAVGPPYNGYEAGAAVTFSVTPYPVTINLAGVTPDTNYQPNILIGQGCTASIAGIPTALMNTGPTCQWKVLGTTFQSWAVTYQAGVSSTGTLTNGPGPLTYPTASWFWSDGAIGSTPEAVSCTVILTPPPGEGSTFTVSPQQAVQVVVPAYTFTCVTGKVQVTPRLVKGVDVLSLWVGPTDKTTRGITWTAGATTPAPFPAGEGGWDFVQTVDGGYTRTTTTGPSQSSPTDPTKRKGLDGAYPYAPATDMPAFGATFTSGDSPGTPVEDKYTTYTSGFTFDTYVMYLPPPANGAAVQYVPLGQIEWTWSASDTLQNGVTWETWPAAQSAGTVSPANPPSGVASGVRQTIHPTWTQLVTPPAWPD